MCVSVCVCVQDSRLWMFASKHASIPALRERLRLEHRAEQLQFGAGALPFAQGSQLKIAYYILQQKHASRRQHGRKVVRKLRMRLLFWAFGFTP